MNVILIFTYGISLKKWSESGLIDRELELYKELEKINGVNFTFVTFGDEEDEVFKNKINNLKILPIYKYTSKSKFKFINFIKTLFVPFKLYKDIKNPDLIKTNQLNGSWVAIVLKFILKIPLIIRTGYNLFEFSVKEKKSIVIRIFNFCLTQFALIFSNIYIVTSNEDKKYLEDKFLYTKNIEVVPNWVKNTRKTNIKNRYNNKVLSIGRLEKQKNYEELIFSLTNSEIQLDIVGNGSLKKNLLELSNKCNTNLKIIEKIPHLELLDFYTKYKIFVLTSTFEGNPKVVLEAMSAGTLVIAYGNKNIEEIITHKENGILFYEYKEIENLINYYLSNESKREKIINRAYETISLNNLISVIRNKEYGIYKELIKLT